MGLDEYADALRARWLLVLVAVLLGGLAALGASAATAPRYRATATLVFTIPVGTSPGDLSRGPAYQRRQMRSISELARQPLVLDPVRRDLGLRASTADLGDDVQVLVPLDTTDLQVVADAGRPGGAAALANAVARQLASTVEALAASPGRGTLVGTASAPHTAVAPRTRLGVAVGLALGTTVGVVLALALDQRARRRRA